MEAELLKKLFAELFSAPSGCIFAICLAIILIFVFQFVKNAADRAFANLAETLQQKTGWFSLCKWFAQALAIAVVIFIANAIYWPYAIDHLASKVTQTRLLEIVSHDKDSDVTESTMQGNIHRVMGAYTLTLPPARPGLHGLFVAQVASVFSIKASPNDHILLGGNELPKGNKISSDGYNSDHVYLRCLNANTWEAEASGLFTDGGS